MKLNIRNNIPTAPALSNTPTATETALQARVTALEQVQTEITTQAERGWGRGPGWVLLGFMILFLAGTGIFLTAWLKSPDSKELSTLKASAANAEVAADKARVEAGKANSELLTKDAQLSAAKTEADKAKQESAKAIADKVNAEKAATEAKTAADKATEELTALKKAKSDADAKAIADAAAAEKAAMLAKLAELAKKLEEKAAMPTHPQFSPAPVTSPSTGSQPAPVQASGDKRVAGHNPATARKAVENIIAELKRRNTPQADRSVGLFTALLNGSFDEKERKALEAYAAQAQEANDAKAVRDLIAAATPPAKPGN